MSSSLQSSEEKRHAHILLCLGLLAGVLVRIISYDFISGDFRESLRPWYAHIAQNGIAAFNTDFSDYNYIYLYCLYIANKFSLSDLAAIKGFSICFDVALLFLSYNMLSLRLSACMSAAGASLVFLLPTVVMNSSKWGQCDSIYSFFMLASIYCLLRRNGSAAFCMLGIGLCFKLQAIFLLPVFGYLVLFERQRRYYNLNFRSLLIIPAIFVLNALPVAIIRKQWQLLLPDVYLRQMASYPDPGYWTAPTIWQFFFQYDFMVKNCVSIGLLFLLVAMSVFLCLVSARKGILPSTSPTRLSGVYYSFYFCSTQNA